MAFWKKPILPEQNVAPEPIKVEAEPTIVSPGVEEKSPIEQKLNNLRSALSEGTVIQGKLSFDTPVRIDGKLNGQVFSSDALFVGVKGEIHAEIEVAELIVRGTVKGNIKAGRRVEIHSGGSVSGSIQTPVLVLEEGGMLDAEVTMKTGLENEANATAEARAALRESEPFQENNEEAARLH